MCAFRRYYISPNPFFVGLALALLYAGLVPAAIAAGATLTIIHSFDDGLGQGQQPVSRLLEHQGKFYGTTYLGGDDGCGTIFSVTASGEFERLHSMLGAQHGCQIPAELTVGGDGNLYGVTSLSGTAPGLGTAFKITPAGEFTRLHSFGGVGNPATPVGGLTLGGDGNFYGTTSGGGSTTIGTAYRMTPEGVVTLLHSFNGLQGAGPRATLVQGPDGALYGTTPIFGSCANSQCGTVFRITSEGDYELVHAFTANFEIPSRLTRGPGDKLYGLLGLGSVSSVSAGGLVYAEDGNFYGFYGGAGNSFFSITPTGEIEILHTFVNADMGIVRITPAGNVTTLISLSDLVAQGFNLVGFLQGGFIQGSDGHLYGTARFGGSGQCAAPGPTTVPCGAVVRVALGVSDETPGGNNSGGGTSGGTSGGTLGGTSGGTSGDTSDRTSGGGGGGAVGLGLLSLLLAAATVFPRCRRERSLA